MTPLRESVPGVSIHAQVIEQILGGTHLVRPGLDRPAGDGTWTVLLGPRVVVLAAILAGPLVTLLRAAA